MSRPSEKPHTAYLRFMGLGLTMAGIIIVFTLLGRWLDGLLGWRVPLLTILLAMAGVTGAMLHLFKETGRRDR